MAGAERKILFSIDLEEFDLPEEYGYSLPVEEKLQVSLPGMQALDAILDKHSATATIFTTAFWANHHQDYMRALAAKHEIASHTYYHNSFKTEDLAASRIALSEITGQDVTGLRMPRMQHVDFADVAAAGYTYDSSLNPTWLPGRYNHFNKPRTLHKNEHIWEMPASVTPILRIPIFWLALKNFPLGFYKMLCNRILNHDGYILFYVHPWEFTDLSKYNVPAMTKRIDGLQLQDRLDQLFTYLSKRAMFTTHKAYLQKY